MNFKSRIEKLDLTRLEDFKEFKNFYSIACKNQDHVENRHIREKLNNTLTWFPITGLQEFPEGWVNKDIADMEDLQELENYYLALSARVTEDYLKKLPMNSVKVIYSDKDNDKSMFYQGNISGLTTAMSLLDSKSEEYKQLEQTRVTYEELDNNIVEKYVKQNLEKEKTERYVNHEIPLLLPTRLHTEKEVRKILKQAGLNNFYNLKVLVTAGVEIQDLETMNKSTELYKGMKEAQEKGELVYKFTLQPGQKL